MPEAESPDVAHGVPPMIDGSLHAIQPTCWGELGVDVWRADHQALEIGQIRRGQGHWGQVVLRLQETVLGLGLSNRTTGWGTVKRTGTHWSDRRVLPE